MKLIALMFCPFAFTTGAFVFSGVLEPMAAVLGVSVAAVATLQSAFAIACALCGPLLAQATRRLPPKALLLAVLALLLALNGVSAMATDYQALFILRLLVGGVGSLAFPLATVLAVAGVTAEDRPKAVSAVYAGIPMSLIVGIPLGSVAGNAFGWPASFVATALICAAALILVWRFVPAAPLAERATGQSRFGPPVFAHLGVTFIAATALFAMVGLIGPIIRATTGFSGTGIAAIQFLAGLSSLAGVRLGARLVAQRARFALLVPFGLLAASLSLVLLPLSLSAGIVSLFTVAGMVASVCFGPAAQSATGALVQSRLADLAGPAATLAFALNGSMIYLGQGLGIVLGAAALTRAGLSAAPLAGLVLTLPGLFLAVLIARRFSDPIPFKEA
ncbi:MFS transporter [Thalassovita mangrovi]|uniref:MFS transporter n=1 Tax=Thalassovita mangrovi TaxID=2692236 RepID=A0A6L8LM04_9RHOB|nr:MFS transporter [Thalassovita mangrovi]MYM56905.1 MFS transporter [Thalassovita mangrovi]